MKLFIFAATLVAVALAGPKNLAPLLAEFSETAIEGQYIVVFKDEVTSKNVESHKLHVQQLILEAGNRDFQIRHHYSIGKMFRGYAATMNIRLVNQVRAMNEVQYVERDQIVKALQAECENQSAAPWNLVRTTTHDYQPDNPPLDYVYGKNDGAGVEAYIIDSGIDVTHPLFKGRAVRGVDFVDNPPPKNGDPNGHGTNMAGIVVADKYGVARSATVISVRVLDDVGYGSNSRVIAGINYVAQKKESDPSKKITGCMALGGSFSASLNNASNACVHTGVHMAVAAGNENKDACNSSPSSADLVVTTAASDKEDRKPSFSDYGTCIDIIAPGDPIISLAPNNGTVSDRGTSQAAAHVTGVIARILSTSAQYDEPNAMRAYLKSIATKNKITGFPSSPSTVNELLYFDDCN